MPGGIPFSSEILARLVYSVERTRYSRVAQNTDISVTQTGRPFSEDSRHNIWNTTCLVVIPYPPTARASLLFHDTKGSGPRLTKQANRTHTQTAVLSRQRRTIEPIAQVPVCQIETGLRSLPKALLHEHTNALTYT